jgi:DNA polymerase-3 subunit epsilon
MRQIVLDTETTGLEVSEGHRIIEIGAVEIVNRKITDRFYHQYLNPERAIDAGAQEVHGISLESLQDKPKFSDICDDFVEFIQGSELIIHNAVFDIGFLNAELEKTNSGNIKSMCTVIDTLLQARQLHPGQRNNLDALCKRYEIDNSHRELHGALLDAQILAEVYLAMTGGQVSLGLKADKKATQKKNKTKQIAQRSFDLQIIEASVEELSAHDKLMAKIAKGCGKASSIWLSSDIEKNA